MRNDFTSYTEDRVARTQKIGSLNLSEEFEQFKFDQEQEHQNLLKKMDKLKTGGMFLAAGLAVAGAATIITGAALPVILGTTAAAYTAAGVSLGAKLKEMFSNKQHDKNYGSTSLFFEHLDKKIQKQNENLFEGFSKEKNPKLEGSLSNLNETLMHNKNPEKIQEIKAQANKFRPA